MGKFSKDLSSHFEEQRLGQMILEAEFEKVTEALEQWSTDNGIHIHSEAQLQRLDTNVHILELKFHRLYSYPSNINGGNLCDPDVLQKYLSDKFNTESGTKLIKIRFEHQEL